VKIRCLIDINWSCLSEILCSIIFENKTKTDFFIHKLQNKGYGSVRHFLYFDPPTLLRPKPYSDFFDQTFRSKFYFDRRYENGRSTEKVELTRTQNKSYISLKHFVSRNRIILQKFGLI